MGRLIIHPGRANDDGELRKAERELAVALAKCGAPDLGAACKAAETRSEASRRQSEAEAQLRVLAPDGIDAIRAMQAAIPEVEDAEDGPTVAEAEETARTATRTRSAATEEAERRARRPRRREPRTRRPRRRRGLPRNG